MRFHAPLPYMVVLQGRPQPQPHMRLCPVAQAVVGQVEPKRVVTITRANLWLLQAPGQREQCVWDQQ